MLTWPHFVTYQFSSEFYLINANSLFCRQIVKKIQVSKEKKKFTLNMFAVTVFWNCKIKLTCQNVFWHTLFNKKPNFQNRKGYNMNSSRPKRLPERSGGPLFYACFELWSIPDQYCFLEYHWFCEVPLVLHLWD